MGIVYHASDRDLEACERRVRDVGWLIGSGGSHNGFLEVPEPYSDCIKMLLCVLVRHLN